MKDKVYVWDPLVRIFHWSLVIAFLTSYITGDENETIHVYSGYFILSLLVIRLVWGFIGTKRARFRDFLTAPSKSIAYLQGLFSGKAQRFEGHNPAGGWMTMLMLTSLILTGLSGLKLYGVEGHGPFASEHKIVSSVEIENQNTLASAAEGEYRLRHEEDEDEHEDEHEQEYSNGYGEHEEHEEAEEFWEEIHEFFVNTSIFLVILHLLGVLVSSLHHKENLVVSMFTGYKKNKRSSE